MNPQSAHANIKSLPALKAWLIEHHLPVERWGQGSAKNIQRLYEELKKGECWLQSDPPMRVLAVVQVMIERNERILVELEQELSDDRRRKRCMPPSEKMKPAEDWRKAAVRCLEEELAINEEQIEIISQTCQPIIKERTSGSYPGLKSQYHIYQVEARANSLPSTDFWTDEADDGQQKQAVRRHLWGWVPREEINI